MKISDQTIEGPLQVVLLGLTGEAKLVNVTGNYGGNNPYLSVPVIRLAPGKSVRVKVRFSNPEHTPISYITQAYAGTF